MPYTTLQHRVLLYWLSYLARVCTIVKAYFLFRTVFRGAGEPTGVGGQASSFIYGHRIYGSTTYRYRFALPRAWVLKLPKLELIQIELLQLCPCT
jgi:hypothetical protein